MKFIVDAQLPRRLARSIIALGDEAVHTLDLPAALSEEDITLALEVIEKHKGCCYQRGMDGARLRRKRNRLSD